MSDVPAPPLSLTATRELLARLGHSPRKALGQNYLVDGNIVRKSLELGSVGPGDRIVEIGPGLGTLTSALLTAGASVWAVERDANMARHLRDSLAPAFPDRFHLIEADAVEEPRAHLPDPELGYKVVANLPYAISTPWMDAILGGSLPDRMVLMLQWEAAQRYTAEPGTKQFGGISIFLQSAYEIAPGHKVASSCFYPRPEVDSYLLHLVRRAHPFVFDAATKALVRSCFQQRRKQIGALLRERLPDRGAAWLARLSEAGLDSRARPEQIPISVWQLLRPA